MKTRDEIMRAHDIIASFLLGEVIEAEFSPQAAREFQIALCTLDWALDLGSDNDFAKNLGLLVEAAEALGYRLEKVDEAEGVH